MACDTLKLDFGLHYKKFGISCVTSMILNYIRFQTISNPVLERGKKNQIKRTEGWQTKRRVV